MPANSGKLYKVRKIGLKGYERVLQRNQDVCVQDKSEA